MSDLEYKEEEEHHGAPLWMCTFADLMCLLLTLFILLLSFAALDVAKFRRLAGSLETAFGVQKDIDFVGAPMGTSMVAQDFSPGRPQKTVTNDIHQSTTELEKQRLDVCEGGKDKGQEEQQIQAQESVRNKLNDAFSQDIKGGKIQIDAADGKVIIRILEKGSFASGSEELEAEFLPVLIKIRDYLKGVEGTIMIEGYTDDRPISTPRFRSNWDLSAARAVSVAQELLLDNIIDPANIIVTGHADTHPIAPNDTDENRSKNRRVEITFIPKVVDESNLDKNAMKKVKTYEQKLKEGIRQKLNSKEPSPGTKDSKGTEVPLGNTKGGAPSSVTPAETNPAEKKSESQTHEPIPLKAAEPVSDQTHHYMTF